MKLLSVQVALFSEDFISRPDLFFYEVNRNLGGVINGIPTIINLPPDAPAEVPIVQAGSNDGFVTINVSRTRIDLIIRFPYETNANPLDSLDDKNSLIQSFYESVLRSITINRIGFVLTLFEPHANGVRAIFKKYFAKEYSTEFIESSMRINKKSTCESVDYNNICSVEAATITVGTESIPGVLFQYDINNILEKGIRINDSIVKHVISQGYASISPESLKEMI